MYSISCVHARHQATSLRQVGVFDRPLAVPAGAARLRIFAAENIVIDLLRPAI
jgi:hypothetical protein